MNRRPANPVLGLVTRRVATASGSVTNAYAYDGLMRLVSEGDSRGNAAAYAYDLCGNRLSVTTPSGAAASTYTHNRRDADTCDAAGNVTRTVNARGQALGLTWNLQRQPTSVSTNGVFAESYAYDPLGRRVATTDMSGTVYHAYDGIHCVADLAPDGTLLRSYTWGAGIDNLLAVTFYSDTETNTLHAVTDPLGTVHALVDASGTVTVAYTYDSWGDLLSVSGGPAVAAANRFTWQGREYSYATGLYSFRARWYDPAAGRWPSKDPIGLEGGLNLYEAFGNNPVCFMDPEGFDFIYIIDKNSVGRNGHVGVITGPVNGKWQYDSFGKPTPNHRHGQYKFDSESNALDFAKERGYTHFGRWYTTEERDCQAQKEAGAWHSGNGDNYLMKKKYKVHSTNCQALVDNMAMAAGIMDDCTYISFRLPWPIRTMSINILMADESGELGQ